MEKHLGNCEEQMKNKLALLIVMLVAFLCAPVCAQPARDQSLSFSQNARSLRVSNKENVVVRASEFGDYGVLVIQRNTEPNGATTNEMAIKAWAIEYSGDSREFSGLKRLSGITQLSPSNIRYINDQLEVSGKAALDRRPVVHLVVPTDVKVTLYYDGQLVRAGSLTDDVIVQGGKIVPNNIGKTTEAAAIAQAMIGGIKKATFTHPDAITPPNKPGDPYGLPWKMLKTLAVLPTEPTFNNRESSDCEECKIAMVRVKVDENGVVTEVRHIAANKNVSKAASDALYQWRFSPFLVNGKAVPVISNVPVQIVDGKLFFGSNEELPKKN